ncbi:MAG: hypothetical protein WC243_02880 [Patescibacteria group bacterium]|jgi:hypothetical protein
MKRKKVLFWIILLILVAAVVMSYFNKRELLNFDPNIGQADIISPALK